MSPDAKRAQYADRKARGLCIRCGKPALDTRCADCAAYDRARINRLRDKRPELRTRHVEYMRQYRERTAFLGFDTYAAFVEWDRREEMLALSEISALHRIGGPCE